MCNKFPIKKHFVKKIINKVLFCLTNNEKSCIIVVTVLIICRCILILVCDLENNVK